MEQKIDKLSVSLGFSEDHWLCKISDIDLESGEFDGSFDLIFDRNFDQGEIRLMTENLVLNPSVQKTMFDGQVSGMSIAGKLLVSKFLIQSWQGDVEIRSLDSEDLSFKRAKLMSNFKNQKLNIQAKIAEGEYKYNSKMKSWVKKLFLNFEDRNEHLVFTNFKVDLNESENKWDWSNLKASLVDDQVQISGHGDLDAKEQLLAEMSFDFPKAKRLSWKIQGPLSEPSFSPLSNNLKSLISKNADYKNLGLGSNE